MSRKKIFFKRRSRIIELATSNPKTQYKDTLIFIIIVHNKKDATNSFLERKIRGQSRETDPSICESYVVKVLLVL